MSLLVTLSSTGRKANCECKLSGFSFILFFLVARRWALHAGQRFLAPLTVTQAARAGLAWPPSSPTASPSRAPAGPGPQGAPGGGGPANSVSHALSHQNQYSQMVSQTKLVFLMCSLCILSMGSVTNPTHVDYPCESLSNVNPMAA